MYPYRRQFLLKSLELFDVVVLAGAFLLGMVAYSQRVDIELTELLALRLTVSNFMFVVVLLGVCHMVLRANGLYQSRRLSTQRADIRDILKAVVFCDLVLAAAAAAFEIKLATSRSFLVTFGAGSAGGLIVSRIFLRSLLAQLRRSGRNLRRILIVGTNERAAEVAGRIGSRPELGYTLVGFADDPWPGLDTLKRMGYRYPLVTDLQNLSSFLRENVIDEVFICLPLKSYYERIRAIVESCESQGIIVRLLGRIFDLRLARATAETFEDDTVVSVYTVQIEDWAVMAKRALDVIGSLALLVAFAPLLLLTAVAIKLTSQGPALFVQDRIGINKRRFRVVKFRTMVVDAERRQRQLETFNEVSGPVFKIRNDPRVTTFGRFLRKTSIDELPQLINVLKGDMSLVGPRPLPVRDYNGFDEDWHRRRFSVRPGITCLWQVNGRSHLPFDRWMELDMQYIDHWSLWLDLKILMKTVPAVLRGSGAA